MWKLKFGERNFKNTQTFPNLFSGLKHTIGLDLNFCFPKLSFHIFAPVD